MTDFVECPACAAKPGSPYLCPSCLTNRDTIAKQRAALVTIAAGRRGNRDYSASELSGIARAELDDD